VSISSSRIGIGREHRHYKWVALSNTTLGTLLATINFSILLISLPAIFRGIGVDPLAPDEIDYLLWLLLSYMVVTAVLVVTAGRISDMVGRVRMYNLGFAIFTVGSVLLFLTPGSGNAAALEMILFRVVQAVGGAFLFANAPAILTDAFPTRQRGFALGLNMIAGSAGQLLGLILGGILAAVDWHLVFLVSVPVGVVGTIWAFIALHETVPSGRRQRIDYVGNLLFAAGLIVFLVALTYGLLPYGTSSMGWTNPLVLAGLIGGPLLLAVFVLVERRITDPMLDISLFRIRPFAAGNAATLLGSIARGGLQFMLIIWLQGIWLPLHGYSFQNTPLWSGIYMIPLLAGFVLLGPLFGLLSDRFGQRWFAAGAMTITAVAFVLLALLPANFSYLPFAAVLILMGLGMGGFMSPNTAWIMNSVPARNRGVAAGARATFQNSGMLLSMAIFFTMVIIGLAGTMPTTLNALHVAGLTSAQHGLIVSQMSKVPPTAALFSAFLGYNPVQGMIPAATLHSLPATAQATLLGHSFFPSLLSPAFIAGLHIAFAIGAALSLAAALTSLVPAESRAARREAAERAASAAAEGERPAREPAGAMAGAGAAADDGAS
jgi:MFS family permease